jgi:hypothetical protein
LNLDELIAKINDDYDGPPLNDEFEELGYGSIYLFDNMGSIFISFVIFPPLIVANLLFALLLPK